MGRQLHLHVMAVPFPAQGHVKPLLKLSQKLAEHGVKVTFVNTEFIHSKFVAASMTEDAEEQMGIIDFVSIPDGLEPEDDRTDFVSQISSLKRVLAGHLENLIVKNSGTGNGKIACVITDASIWTKLDVAAEMGIKEVVFVPSGAGGTALVLHIPKLIEQGIIDVDGSVMKNEVYYLSEKSPPFDCTDLPWRFPGYPEAEKLFFTPTANYRRTVEHASLILCNTFYELESSACDSIQNFLPVGPLLSNSTTTSSGGNFWPEDFTSLNWLDKQQAGSVIYVAFGSIAIFSQHQFSELALALEDSGRPFLWVVRSSPIINGSLVEYPKGFLDRVGDRGKIVEWAPQEKVLAHQSIGCFFSHCGWNSTLEGLSFGVPFLCWPYFADQFQNRSYICNVWKVGLSLYPDGNGIMSKDEILEKIESLLLNDEIRANVEKHKEIARASLNEGGSSTENFEIFMNYLKD